MKHIKKFEGFDNIDDTSIEQSIISILGKNHKDPIQFTHQSVVNGIYGIYTHKGSVYVFRQGQDIPFYDKRISDKERKEILNSVESKKWIVSKTLSVFKIK